MKEKIKRMMPKSVWKKLRQLKSVINLNKAYSRDRRRYAMSYSKSIEQSTQQQLEGRLMFHAHAIEKGLSHEDFRPKFGLNALESLSKVINEYNKEGFDKSQETYKIALSSISNYLNIHKDKNIDVSFVEEVMGHSIYNEIVESNTTYSGIISVKKDEKLNNQITNFKNLCYMRKSVREFSDEEVDLTKIKESIQIATQSPSACNRQPSRVYILSNSELIEKVLKIQGGFTGYKNPPILLLVTATNSVFNSANERNEGFIDGGIFSMSLLLSLEYNGLAACTLNAMFNSDIEIRQLLDVPDDETFILFIAVGNFKDKVLVPKSFKISLDTVVKEIE